MQTVIRRFILVTAMFTAFGALPLCESQATACPNCKAANESDSLKPKAYMYSILFMIGMPATIFAGFSVSFWRMNRQAQLQQELVAANESTPDSEAN
jgi:hypothetical protein